MQVKIDTREKFHVITILDENLSANMTAEMQDCLLAFLDSPVKNVVLKLSDTKNLDLAAAETLVQLQQTYYEKNASFVVCELDPDVEEFLDQSSLLELMNITPTETEAWDIVQMEEIERELLGGEDV